MYVINEIIGFTSKKIIMLAIGIWVIVIIFHLFFYLLEIFMEYRKIAFKIVINILYH
jgi:hypothetical protein